MDSVIHGGDIYRNQVEYDFSVNTNPLGISETVKNALQESIVSCETYPDIIHEELRRKLLHYHKLENQNLGINNILCGNGASELFMAIAHSLAPKKVLLLAPSFFGYEYVAKAVECEIVYYTLKEEEGFQVTRELLHSISGVDMVFLANPNNPVGNVVEPELLIELCEKCRKENSYVVLDECFIEFTGKKSAENYLQLRDYPNVMVVRAFTKIYAMPGVRLGYLLNGDDALCQNIRKHLPEWNLSVFAQKAGCAALRDESYISDTVEYITRERKYMTEALQKMGVKVYSSCANFLLIRTQKNLQEVLLKEKIMIRDCCNYHGLENGFFRIAIKKHEENQILLEKVGGILEQN